MVVVYDEWTKDGTDYGIMIWEDPHFYEKYHGKYLVVLWGQDGESPGRSNFLNDGYIDPSYVRSHFHVRSIKDSENLAEKLNEVIGD